jgi:pyridine nucleotide-disulfide oxidoreductase family protein
MKRLLLLGGGHAHVHVLHDLAKRNLAGAEVVLVSPFDDSIYSGMVPGWVAGHYALDECRIAVAALALAGGVRFARAAAVALDAAAREVTLSDGRALAYDVLSIDTGSVLPRDVIPGARVHALPVRPMEGFVAHLSEVLLASELHDIAIIGSGAAGVELAMALQHRLGGDDHVRVSLVCGTPEPLAGFAAGTVHKAMRALKKRHVTLLPDTCTQILSDHVLLAHGTRLACDVAVLALGPHAPAWLRGSGLSLDASGFVSIGATLQSVSHPEVFAAGDVASRGDAPHPKSGVHAVRAGPPLARNLRRHMAGQPLRNHQPPKRTLNLLSCGGKTAIATWGRWSVKGDWVWRWKDHIDRAFVERYRRVVALKGATLA